MVSVVLTSYNKEKYIRQAIESVLRQTYDDFELIIVDDGSSDNSTSIIEEYKMKDRRIKTFYFEKNKGIPSAHNKGISLARGDYLAMMDCDDYWDYRKLEKQVQVLENNDEYGACFTWINVVDENGEKVSSNKCECRDLMWNSENHTQGEWLRLFFTEGCKLGNPSILIRRTLINLIGGYSAGLRQLQDYELFVRILKKCNVYILRENLVFYRWFLGNTKNTSYNNIENANRSNVEYFLVAKDFFEGIDENILLINFSDLFIKKDKDEINIHCEEINLLKNNYVSSIAGRMAAMEKMYLLLNQEKVSINVMENYGFTSANFANELKDAIFYDKNYYIPIKEGSYVENLQKKIELIKNEWYKTINYTRELEEKEKESVETLKKYRGYIEELENQAHITCDLIEKYKRYISELEKKNMEAFDLYKKCNSYALKLEDRIREEEKKRGDKK